MIVLLVIGTCPGSLRSVFARFVLLLEPLSNVWLEVGPAKFDFAICRLHNNFELVSINISFVEVNTLAWATLTSSGSWLGTGRSGTAESSRSSSELSDVNGEDIPDARFGSLM